MLIDLATPAMQRNPYPAYAEMRRQPSLAQVRQTMGGSSAYFVTRYDDALMVLRDPRFSSDPHKVPTWDDWTKKWYIPAALKAFVDSMALVDEPDHTRLRQLVHKAFTPAMIQQLTGRIEHITHDLLDAAARRPVTDFMAEFALPLPLTVISDMMGVPQADRPRFRRWMSDTITDLTPGDPLRMARKLLNALRLNGLLKRMVAERRRSPQDDLTTALVQAEAGGDRLSESELLSMLMVILFAGHETTVNLIASGTLALLQHPEQWALLKARPDLLESAVEELLRYVSPVQHVAQRYALEEVEVGGVRIPQYSEVLVGVAAANRDETVFENAEGLDITRSPNRHIAFGFGVHYCLGAPLARLEAKIAFSALMQRFPDMQLAVSPDALVWRGIPALRGLERLPLRLRPAGQQSSSY